MAKVKYVNVDGEFPCPACGTKITSGASVCPTCGTTYGDAHKQSTPTHRPQTAKATAASNTRFLTCGFCGAHFSELELKENDGKCLKCGAPWEENPKPSPKTTPKMKPQAQPYSSAPSTNDTKNSVLFVVLGIIGVIVIGLIIASIVNAVKKSNERIEVSGFVSSDQWTSEYQTLMPYAEEKTSDSPVSGPGITPMASYTEVVGWQDNPLPTQIISSVVEGPTGVSYGDVGRECLPSEAEPIRKEDGSFEYPICFDETYTPGENITITEVVRPMGTPTPIYGVVYPYIETGMQPGTPLLLNGTGTDFVCPDVSKLPVGWTISSECGVTYSLTVNAGDGMDVESFDVSKEIYLANRNNNNLVVVVNGYGDIVEVKWP